MKQARFSAVQQVQAVARGTTKMSGNLLRFQCGSSVQCANSVQPDVMTYVKTSFCFETQGPCGSVRTCDVDTVTDDTSAKVKDVTTVFACIR